MTFYRVSWEDWKGETQYEWFEHSYDARNAAHMLDENHRTSHIRDVVTDVYTITTTEALVEFLNRHFRKETTLLP
jgi:hypothetical protein